MCLTGVIERFVDGLPTLESSRMRIFRIVQEEGSGADEIVTAVSSDPAIAAKIVRLANSPFYRHADTHAGLTLAIRTIGLDMVKCIALSMAVMQLFKPGSEIMRMLWEHSYEVALVSGSLACTRHERELLFTGGLLHDLGRMVLTQAEPAAYRELYDSVGRWPAPAVEMERFQVDHCGAGGALSERWRFPPEVARIVRCHHAPTERYSALVGLTDYILGLEKPREEPGEDEILRFVEPHLYQGYKELVNTIRNRYRTNTAIVENLG